MPKMKVAVFTVNGDFSGSVDLYEVDSEEFFEAECKFAPMSEGDWHEFADWVREHGKPLLKFSPDYSITVFTDE
jgi:hypothetical protein